MKKVLSFTMVILMLLGMCVFPAFAADERAFSHEFYHSRFEKTFDRLSNSSSYEMWEGGLYNELMIYRNDDNIVYTLVYPSGQVGLPREGYKQLGDYVIIFPNYHHPYPIGYYVYVASADEAYTLTEAYDMEVEGISEVFPYLIEKKVCALAGDTDLDGKLTVRDATRLQKKLAGLVSKYPFENNEMDILLYYGIEDMNSDKEINIKDATAIQKKIAGLPY